MNVLQYYLFRGNYHFIRFVVNISKYPIDTCLIFGRDNVIPELAIKLIHAMTSSL